MPIQKIAYSSLEENQTNYINILRDNQSVTDTGWRRYADTAGVNPVTGTGGSAGITWSQNTSNPLSGNADLRLVKDNSNRQGEGVSIDFTIDNRHLAKVLQITFDTELISANGTYLNPISSPVSGLANASNSTTCTITANNSLQNGQSVFVTFASNPPVNNYYTVSSVTSTSFVITLASAATLSNAVCNYTAISDLRVSIIQDPNGTPVVIEPVNTGISLGISNPRQRIRHIATFQTHISLRTYRLCIHVANASTVAYTVDFANFKVWEPTQSIGSVITDWQSYTPTFSGFVTSSQDFQWRRIGSNVEIQGKWTTSSGSGNEIRIPLPNGLVIDSAKIPSLRVTGIVGRSASAAGYFGAYITAEPSVSYLTLSTQASSLNSLTKRLGSDLTTGAETMSMYATVPIAGWGSSVAMSSDTGDGRVVAAKYKNQPSQTSSATVPLQFTTLEYDTHNAVTVGTVNTSNAWRYTAPVSGYYRITVSSYCNTTATAYHLYRNGVNVGRIADFISTAVTSASTTISLNSGDFIDIRCGQSFPAYPDAYISIERISAGSQVIASSEDVNCQILTWSNSITSTSSPIVWVSTAWDTHGAFNRSTSRFTPPVAGKYEFTFRTDTLISSLLFLGFSLFDVTANSSLKESYIAANSQSNALGSVSVTLRLTAGQVIEVRLRGNTSGSLGASQTTNDLNIKKIGNY